MSHALILLLVVLSPSPRRAAEDDGSPVVSGRRGQALAFSQSLYNKIHCRITSDQLSNILHRDPIID